jgi:hypothetical protein
MEVLMKRKFLIIGALILFGLVSLLAFVSVPGLGGGRSQWSVEGRRIGVDSCPVGCPCVLGEAPHHGTCQAITIYHVDKGRHGRVDLANTKFAIAGDFTQRTREDKPVYTYTAYYIDSAATPGQITALKNILAGPAFAGRGGPAEVKELPIRITNLGGYGQVGQTYGGTVGEIAKVEVTPVSPVRSKEPSRPLVVENPANHPSTRSIILGRASGSFYRSGGKVFEFDGTAGESMDFSFQGTLE